ncbi:hypothetical protein MXD62_16750 [Frankia sp. Mgl5]|uniref:hypothetical protein n=1 Tax=Frankia sp. Mgl5 TaxID=2933793 RepID=UPI00200BB7A0|nr:hypothetical protein [Frankia sp. Mgl5]MCK9928806.1 hypothetical protein [Frankia sp. Mgl5]
MVRVALDGQDPGEADRHVTIDFDAYLAEHDTATPVTIRVGGRLWDLPASLPSGFMLRASALEARGQNSRVTDTEAESMLRGLFGRQATELLDGVPEHTFPDLLRLVLDAYRQRMAERRGNAPAPTTGPNRPARRGNQRPRRRRPPRPASGG